MDKERLLDEIRLLSKKRMDPAVCEEMLEEVRAHLDASIQARHELGQTLELAEEEAVSGFGSASQFVDGYLPARPNVSRIRLWTFVATLAVLMWAAFLSGLPKDQWSSTVAVLYYLPVIIGISFVAWSGWRGRKVQIRTLVDALAVAIPLCAIGISLLFEPRSSHIHVARIWMNAYLHLPASAQDTASLSLLIVLAHGCGVFGRSHSGKKTTQRSIAL